MKTVSLLIAITIMIGLFGCAAAPKDLAPTHTANDFLKQFNGILKKDGLSGKFVVSDIKEYDGYFWAECVNEKNSDMSQITLRLQYSNDLDSPLSQLAISATNSLTEEEAALHRRLCLSASTLCDKNITRDMFEQLYDEQGKDYTYATYENGIASFVIWTDAMEKYSYRVYQPTDLTHVFFTYQQAFNDGISAPILGYNIYFTDASENVVSPYEKKYMTVSQMENAVNEYFNSIGLPMEGVFEIYDYQERHKELGLPSYTIQDQSVTHWQMRFRFTNLEDPDTHYPTFATLDHEYPAMIATYIEYWLPFELTITANGVSHDSAISGVEYKKTIVRNDADHFVKWDSSWDEITIQLQNEIINTWLKEVGNESLSAYLNGERNDWAATHLISSIDFTESYGDDTSLCYSYCYTDTSEPVTESSEKYYEILHIRDFILEDGGYTAPDNLFSPELLEYRYTLNSPRIPDDISMYITHTGDYDTIYRTDIYGGSTDDINALTQYLDSNASKFNLQFDHRYDDVEEDGTDYSWLCQYLEAKNYDWLDIYEFYDNDAHVEYDTRYFGIFERPLLVNIDLYHTIYSLPEHLCVYYNESKAASDDLAYILRASIGLSQLWDEEMTVDEAIALHTEEQEITLVYNNWNVTFYAPRKVTHMIAKNTETGQTLYTVVPKAIAEEVFLLDDFMAEYCISRYEYYLNAGWLDNQQ